MGIVNMTYDVKRYYEISLANVMEGKYVCDMHVFCALAKVYFQLINKFLSYLLSIYYP